MQRHVEAPLARQCLLAGGDDYELCFTAPSAHHAEVTAIGERLGLPLVRIGKIVAGNNCMVCDAAGDPLGIGERGYDHFR